MQVVNVKNFGGVREARAAGVAYVGRPSALGNPFVMMSEAERPQVIQRYRRWLWEKMKSRDKAVLNALDALHEDSTLGCWCHPLPCHADVIKRAWGWRQCNPLY